MMEALLSAPLDKCGNRGSELMCLGKVNQRGRDSNPGFSGSEAMFLSAMSSCLLQTVPSWHLCVG